MNNWKMNNGKPVDRWNTVEGQFIGKRDCDTRVIQIKLARNVALVRSCTKKYILNGKKLRGQKNRLLTQIFFLVLTNISNRFNSSIKIADEFPLQFLFAQRLVTPFSAGSQFTLAKFSDMLCERDEIWFGIRSNSIRILTNNK